MKQIQKKRLRLKRRHQRLRRRLSGDEARPRLLLSRSLAHTYAQIIDDATGRTLLTANTRQADVRGGLPKTNNREAAAAIGKAIAEKALAQGITQVCFDRGGRKYHGRVKAAAEAAREAGLKF